MRRRWGFSDYLARAFAFVGVVVALIVTVAALAR